MAAGIDLGALRSDLPVEMRAYVNEIKAAVEHYHVEKIEGRLIGGDREQHLRWNRLRKFLNDVRTPDVDEELEQFKAFAARMAQRYRPVHPITRLAAELFRIGVNAGYSLKTTNTGPMVDFVALVFWHAGIKSKMKNAKGEFVSGETIKRLLQRTARLTISRKRPENISGNGDLLIDENGVTVIRAEPFPKKF
jgi:uncharacterized protein (DUF849 family)